MPLTPPPARKGEGGGSVTRASRWVPGQMASGKQFAAPTPSPPRGLGDGAGLAWRRGKGTCSLVLFLRRPAVAATSTAAAPPPPPHLHSLDGGYYGNVREALARNWQVAITCTRPHRGIPIPGEYLYQPVPLRRGTYCGGTCTWGTYATHVFISWELA